MTFWDWLLIKWRSFQVAALSIPRSSDCWVAIHGVDGPQPVLPFAPDRHPGSFQFGAILSTAAVVVRVRDSVRTFRFSRISTRKGSFWAAGWSKNLPSCLPKGCAHHDEREPPCAAPHSGRHACGRCGVVAVPAGAQGPPPLLQSQVPQEVEHLPHAP